ncbi:CD109 antigen-like isoform X2 [Synchiropus splendidus]|uniref:CD109 antigen-like isoform X2 n=1 Tax=Synchiropus splendidus TaxID=270530 RepID=UPI00237DBFD7|nr:CD109 antigen-like isoform X2 [Synchiropus splendidus]
MGNFSSKDNHGASGAPLDSLHAPPASLQTEEPRPKSSIPQLHPPTSPKASLPAPGSSPPPVPGLTPDTRPRPVATVITPVHDKADTKGNADSVEDVAPPASTPRTTGSQAKSAPVVLIKSPSEASTSPPFVLSHSDLKWQESGLSPSPRRGLEIEESEMEKLLDECLATLHISPKEDEPRNIADILRQLQQEVINLRTTMQSEQTDWLQFQNDFQVAVAVADRLRAEAEEELLVLRASHKDIERELEDAKRRQKEADVQLVALRDELKESQRKLALVTRQASEQHNQEPNNNHEGNQKGQERGLNRLGHANLSSGTLNDGRKVEDNKSVTKLYLRNLANKEKSAEITRTALPERSRSLSRSASSEPPTVQNGTLLTSSITTKSANTIRVCRSLNDQDSRLNPNTGKREESLKRYNSTTAGELPPNISPDGFNMLLHRHGGSKRNWMLHWCQSRTQGYKNIEITNFSSSWVDGLAFCALYHTYLPSRIPYSTLSPENKRENLSLAFRTGLAVGISPSLTTEEMLRAGGPDWQRVLSYVETMSRVRKPQTEAIDQLLNFNRGGEMNALMIGTWTPFMITGPDEVHAGTPTQLALTVFSDFSTRVTAEMVYGDTSVVQTEEVEGGLTRILTLPAIKDSPSPAVVNLTLKGYKDQDVIFSSRRMLIFRPTNVSSFIVTDRSRYYPGDSVKVWVASVESDNRPYEGGVEVSIQDPEETVVTRWESTGNLGIVLQEFNLSHTPPLGQWSVSVTINGVKTERNFTVEQYDPPIFTIVVRTATRVLVGDDVSGSVRATYTSGKPVEGTLTISLSRGSGTELLTHTKQIYGSAKFLFSNAQLESTNTSEPVRVSASVTDASSGFKASRDVQIQFSREKFLLEFCDFPRLKPALHFFSVLKISRFDGKPLSLWDRVYSAVVEVIQRTSSAKAEPTVLTLAVPEDGNVFIQFRLQDDIQAVFLRARFQSSVKKLTVLHAASTTTSSMQILPAPAAQIGVPLRIDVESTVQLSELHYVVTSREQVLISGVTTSLPFTLSPTRSWSPEAYITVYSLLPGGELHSTTGRIPLHQHGYVTVDWSSDRAHPGEQVSLALKALEPMSHVALLVMGAHDDSPQDMGQNCNLWRLSNSLRPSEELAGPSEDALIVERYWRQWTDGSDSLLWLDAEMSDGNWTSEEITVPDGFTSLRAVAVSMSDTYGLVFTPVPQTLPVSKDFSLSLDVPSALFRGEELVLEVKVINHLEQEIEVIVLLAHSEAFEFVLADRGDVSVLNAQKLTIQSHSSDSALFPVRFVSTGQTELSVDAVSADASDSLIWKVLVKVGNMGRSRVLFLQLPTIYFSKKKSEGVPQSATVSHFLELAPMMNNKSISFSFSFPANVVPGSQRAFLALVGDTMALSIQHLEQLVQPPLGSGEQNMIRFAPNVYVLQYLDRTDQEQPEIRSRALGYMTEGYQRQLTYQRSDGSFGDFGDSSGSVWLTAFVLRCFQQAQLLMSIDYSVLTRARSWLLGHQGPQGEFRELGKVIHTELHEDLDVGSVGLTAYVLIALLENPDNVELFPANVSLATKYLEDKVSSGVVSNYSLSLAAYALSLAVSPAADTALNTLALRADNRERVMMWSTSAGLQSHDWRPRSTQVEMTSYVALAHFQRRRFPTGIEQVKWLSSQRDHHGGYGSTQATVVALQALSYYATFSGASAIDLMVQLTAEQSVFRFHINSSTYLSYYRQEMNAGQDIHLSLYLEGRGFAVLQMNVFYNLDSRAFSQSLAHTTDQEDFALNVGVLSETDQDHIIVSVCMRLKSSAPMSHTGMALLDVGMLSGFSLSPGAAVKTGLIRQMEIFPEKVTFNLHSLNKSEVCITLPMIRVYKMAQVQEAVVLLYDYYEPTRRATATYAVKSPSHSCHYCGDNCQRCRPGVALGVTSNPPPNSACSALYSTSLASFSVFLYLFI